MAKYHADLHIQSKSYQLPQMNGLKGHTCTCTNKLGFCGVFMFLDNFLALESTEANLSLHDRKTTDCITNCTCCIVKR